MAFDLFFEPHTFDVDKVNVLRTQRWHLLPNKIGHYVSIEEQSLRFNLMMLDRARHTTAGCYPASVTYSHVLGLSIRATFVKSIILQSASIIEAVLRHIAEHRGYKLPSKTHHRTMGKVLQAWCTKSGNPKPELVSHWSLISNIHEIRNNVHIFKAVNDPNSTVDNILANEANLIPHIIPLLDFLANLLNTVSPVVVPPPPVVVPPPPVMPPSLGKS